MSAETRKPAWPFIGLYVVGVWLTGILLAILGFISDRLNGLVEMVFAGAGYVMIPGIMGLLAYMLVRWLRPKSSGEVVAVVVAGVVIVLLLLPHFLLPKEVYGG